MFSKLIIVFSVIIEIVIKFFVRSYVNFLPLTLALSPIEPMHVDEQLTVSRKSRGKKKT